MAQWRVQLKGEQFDLKELKEILLGHDPYIIEEDGAFISQQTLGIKFRSQGKFTVRRKNSSRW